MFDVSSSKPTLLVIDDIPENLTLMYQLLKEEYKIKGANSGLKGISIAESTSPDLILLDIMMPDMDGFAVCEQLKANPKLSMKLETAVSAYDFDHALQLAREFREFLLERINETTG